MTFMFDAAIAALREIFSPPFRNVLLKSLGMTFLFLALAWVGLDKVALSYIAVNHPWLQLALTYATGVGLVVVLAFLIAPISVLVAGLFLDDLADVVEEELYPPGRARTPASGAQAISWALRFALVSAGVNLLALLLLLVPGVNAIGLRARQRLFVRPRIFRLRGDALPLAGGGTRADAPPCDDLVPRGAVHRRLRRRAGTQSVHALVRRRLHGAHAQTAAPAPARGAGG